MIYFHRILLIIFGLPTAYFVYSLFSVEKSEFVWMVVPLGLVLATVLVFRHQIDEWWVRTRKPKPDETLISILRQKIPGYDQLFDGRAHLPEDHVVYTNQCDFIGQGLETIPDDLKHIITAHAFYFGGADHKKWPRHYDRVVLYKHPFLSPKYNEEVHTVEHHFDDGVLIFSLEQGLPAIDRPDRFYNIFIHGYADAFLELYPISATIPDEELWSRLTDVVGISQEQIAAVIGLSDVNPLAVIAHFYCYQPGKLSDAFPELKHSLFANINVPIAGA